ncbi:ABC transporter permease [Fodinisporobacter ferrooxydans]|uniref:ABC transporter permease n=1 Tax=Fodinisporobacter ferrooxydans TaxID=2901836 RepID=A0ABY4CMD2_9BACL|nr:ABC transporter permease [Alicyclobacillaceae bacterium MYW30-H2]
MSTQIEKTLGNFRQTASMSARGHERILGMIQKRGAIAILVLVIIIASFSFPGFFSVTNLETIFLQSSFLGLIVVGQTLVIITGGIDLTVGSLVAFSSVAAALLVPVSWSLGIIVPILLGAIIGMINGFLIAKARMAPFIVTLAGLLGVSGLALALSNQQDISINSTTFSWIGQGLIGDIGVPVFFMVAAYLIGAVVLNYTKFGHAIFAIGGNEESARLMGVSVNRVKIITYTISGALASLAGVLLASELSAGQPTLGTGWELNSISAVVVGGTLLTGGSGTISGSFAGVLLLGVLQDIINQAGNLGTYAQQVLSGAFIVAVVLLQAYLTRKRRRKGKLTTSKYNI